MVSLNLKVDHQKRFLKKYIFYAYAAVMEINMKIHFFLFNYVKVKRATQNLERARRVKAPVLAVNKKTSPHYFVAV